MSLLTVLGSRRRVRAGAAPPGGGGASPVADLMGPYLPSADITALGGVYAEYEADFITFDEPQWTSPCSSGSVVANNCNYYDRAMIYYVWWQRTGDAKYLTRAESVVTRFRDNYVIANNYLIASHEAMMDGIALHALLNDDAVSLGAVGKVGDYFAWGSRNPSWGFDDPEIADNRAQAYAIKSLLLAYLLSAPSTGIAGPGIPGGNVWADELRDTLDRILASRDPDGQWRGAKCTGGTRSSHPFTIGLLYDSLIRYYEHFEADSRIPATIEASAEILWTDDWLPASNAFKYVGVNCPPEGGPTPAADLNNIIVNGFAWTAKRLASPTWWARADAMFAGSVSVNSPSSGPKQFNQSYTSSYRYLAWRQGL